MQLLSSEVIDWIRIDYTLQIKVHTFHGSEVLTAAIATEITLAKRVNITVLFLQWWGHIEYYRDILVKPKQFTLDFRLRLLTFNKLLGW